MDAHPQLPAPIHFKTAPTMYIGSQHAQCPRKGRLQSKACPLLASSQGLSSCHLCDYGTGRNSVFKMQKLRLKEINVPEDMEGNSRASGLGFAGSTLLLQGEREVQGTVSCSVLLSVFRGKYPAVLSPGMLVVGSCYSLCTEEASGVPFSSTPSWGCVPLSPSQETSTAERRCLSWCRLAT